MKRIVAALLLIALSFSMLACAAPAPAEAAAPAETAAPAEASPTETPEEEIKQDNVAYFEDIVREKFDSFGKKTGETHYIAAFCKTVNVFDSNETGEVSIQYYDDGMSRSASAAFAPFAFWVYTRPDHDAYVKFFSFEFMIDEEQYVYYLSSYDEDKASIIYNALIDGKDVIISCDRGKFYFTISGKGFKDLIESLADQ